MMKKYFLGLMGLGLVLVLSMSSCMSQKKIKILQPTDGQEYNRNEFNPINQQEYKLAKGDNLYIQVSTQDPQQDAASAFSKQGSNGTYFSEVGIYLNSYTVDDKGEILVPVIGNINVDGLTVGETKTLLEENIAKYVNDPIVVVKMVNFNITLLGEVSRPGEYKVYQNKINLLEAFSLAGDITTYGNRHEVKLLRQNGKKIEMHVLNLSAENIIESPYFYLKPNDVLYVEPLKGKQFAFETFPYGLLFSTISTVIMLITFLRSTK